MEAGALGRLRSKPIASSKQELVQIHQFVVMENIVEDLQYRKLEKDVKVYF